MLNKDGRHFKQDKEYWSFGNLIYSKDLKMFKPIYNQFLSSKTETEMIDSFLEISNIFIENQKEIRRGMTEREFAAIVGARLEEFVYQTAIRYNKQFKKNADIATIRGKRCKMIIYEIGNQWLGQGADLAIGKWEYIKKYKDNFFIPKIIIESKRYVALSPQLRDLGILAIKWKEKYPNIKFLVFSEHNDLDPQSSLLMLECWGNAIDDLFFIKEGTRSLERRGVHKYIRKEIERFLFEMKKIFMNL